MVIKDYQLKTVQLVHVITSSGAYTYAAGGILVTSYNKDRQITINFTI